MHTVMSSGIQSACVASGWSLDTEDGDRLVDIMKRRRVKASRITQSVFTYCNP